MESFTNIVILPSSIPPIPTSPPTTPIAQLSTPTIIPSYLLVKCFKWRHSFNKSKYDEFFDYESKDFAYNEYKIKSNSTIIDNFTSLEYKENLLLNSNNYYRYCEGGKRDFLKENITIKYNKENNNYIIHNTPYSFISLNHLDKDNENCVLQIGDKIKIGKYSLDIQMIKIDNFIRLLPTNYNSGQGKEELLNTNETICRICLRSNTDIPFISVCNCKGSIKYSHTTCLNEWIKSSCHMSFEYINPFVFYLRLEKFYCEICKTSLPFGVYINNDNKSESNNFFYLVEALKGRNVFILLAKNYYYNKENDNTNMRSNEHIRNEKAKREYFLIDLSNSYKNHVTIGRGRNCIFNINDISISREHCVISYDKDKKQIRISDSKSKFGTLINERRDIEISNNNNNITIQKGNTVYNFSYCIV